MQVLHEIMREHMKDLAHPGPINSPIKRHLHTGWLTQSQSIRYGTAWENSMKDYVDQSSAYVLLSPSGVTTFIAPDGTLTTEGEGNKDIDIVFRSGDVVYYRESKCNLKLDSEKKKATTDKVKLVKERLQMNFPDYKIDAAILNMEWDGKQPRWTQKNGVRVEYAAEFIERLGVERVTHYDYLKSGKSCGEELLKYATNS